MNIYLSKLSRFFLILTSVLVVLALFVPIWRIELDAPQYPEGLELQIHANGIEGQVDIINGLNHYIGMKTLHSEDFIEFTILPYIIVAFALLFLISGIIGRKKWLYFSFWAFLIFGIVAMIDFWLWEYNYGHNLDPTAAIIVPGMSYQPPLIGYKQLLNFGAYSIPDIGGWLFISGAMLLAISLAIETNILSRFRRKKSIISLLLVGLLPLGFTSCISTDSQPIKLNSDKCGFCQMTISDGKFGAELLTKKGRAYKFDDFQCMQGYMEEKGVNDLHSYYVHDFSIKNTLIDAKKAYFVKHESLKSPMGGNIAAFKTNEKATEFAKNFDATILSWEEVNKH